MKFSDPPKSAYARLWTGVLEPGFYLLRGKKTSQLGRQVEKSQWWSQKDLQDWQWAELAKLLDWAHARVPFYREWFAQNALKPALVVQERNLELLPVITRAMLNQNPEQFRADPPPPGSYHKSTGGTSGSPLHFMVDSVSDQWRNAVTRRGYTWAGACPGNRQLHVWSADLVPLAKRAQLKRGLHRLLMRYRFINGVYITADTGADEVLSGIDRFRPYAVITYPSTAEVYCRRALETGWKPRRAPYGVITGAETLYDHQRELIEQALGCRAFETYGSREFMLIACECPGHKGMHVSEENLMVEILADGRKAAPGELGEVTVTDLHNYAQPFIRYGIGDVSSWLPDEPCACGRHMRRMGKVEGRVADVFRNPQGRMMSGLFFPHLLKDYKCIDRFQIVQERLDLLTIRLKLHGPLRPEDARFIIEKSNEFLPGVEIKLQEVDEVDISPTGKIRAFIGMGTKAQTDNG